MECIDNSKARRSSHDRFHSEVKTTKEMHTCGITMAVLASCACKAITRTSVQACAEGEGVESRKGIWQLMI